MKHSFCEDWEFTRHWTEAFGKGLPVPKQQAVRLPHTCREVPLHYASPADYEMVCGYRKRFRVPPVQAAPRLFVRFDGAAHQAVVRLNGKVAGQHRGGYTGFTVEITDLVDREGENLLTVQLDTREDPAIPPFGFVIDYLTYGGLYREVWLETTAESRLTDLFVYTPTLQEAVVQWTAELTPAAVAVRIRLETADGTLLAQQTAQAAETGKIQLSVPDAQPWDAEHPVLHHAVAELLNAAGQAIDRKLLLLPAQRGKLAQVLAGGGVQCFGVAVKLLLAVSQMHQRHQPEHHPLVAGGQIVQHFLGFLALEFHIVGNGRGKIVVGILTALPVGDIRFYP